MEAITASLEALFDTFDATRRGLAVARVCKSFSFSVVEANGRVMAAAPDLLEACQSAYVALPMAKHNEESLALLKAAILKAGGRV